MAGHHRRALPVTSAVFGAGARWKARRDRRLWAIEGLENRVLLAATIYTVNAITDTGAGSGTTGDLLYCIKQANSNPNTDGSVIEFDPTVFGSPQTITLSSTLVLSETAGPEVIDGPGASLVTVSGNNAVGVFSVVNGVTATLTGLTISGGSTAGNGGGIDNGGTLTVTGCTIDNNAIVTFFGGGGGIYNAGTLTVQQVHYRYNSSAPSLAMAAAASTTLARRRSPAPLSTTTRPGALATAAAGSTTIGMATVTNSTLVL